MSELETRIRGYLATHPKWTTADIADWVMCSERTVRRVKQKVREEKEVEYCKQFPAIKKPAALKPDMVNSPPHYTTGGIEVIDYIKAKLTPEEFRGYLRGNVIKYSSRLGHKDIAAQEAGKLAWYANKLNEVV